MLTLDTNTMKWMPISTAAKQVGRSRRQVERYINAGHVSAASFSGSPMTFVDIEELKAFLCEKIECAGCPILFKRSGKKKYHSPKCRLKHYQQKRRANAERNEK